MKCLVTGGAGFIGSNLVKLLLENNHEVTVLDNLSTGYKENLAPFEGKIEFIEGDIRNISDIEKAIEGKDSVFHLAASVGNKKSIDEPLFDANCNILGVINVLESMRKYKVGNIVFSSSAGIFGEPQYQPVDEVHPCEPDSPYGSTKLGGEKLILSYMKMYDIRAVCLRYFNVYGVNQRFDAYGNVIPIFVSRALAGKDLTIFGDGEQTRDFICVSDIALANLKAAEMENVRGTFNLGTGHSITINKLAESIKEIVNPDIKIIHGETRLGDVRHCTAKVERINNDMKLFPDSNVIEKLQEYCQWMKQDPLSK
tara:strand:- start:125608 stop:126543 length:936 start_codon:yes stop_codon:yes gene_type:complete